MNAKHGNDATKLRSKIKRMRETLLMAAREIERESERYRDGDTYQPHGVGLRVISGSCRRSAVVTDFVDR